MKVDTSLAILFLATIFSVTQAFIHQNPKLHKRLVDVAGSSAGASSPRTAAVQITTSRPTLQRANSLPVTKSEVANVQRNPSAGKAFANGEKQRTLARQNSAPASTSKKTGVHSQSGPQVNDGSRAKALDLVLTHQKKVVAKAQAFSNAAENSKHMYYANEYDAQTQKMDRARQRSRWQRYARLAREREPMGEQLEKLKEQASARKEDLQQEKELAQNLLVPGVRTLLRK